MIVDRYRQNLLGLRLPYHVAVERRRDLARSRGTDRLGIRSLFSSRMMSMQRSTHSLQMNTAGPAISFTTSCWLLPQKEQ